MKDRDKMKRKEKQKQRKFGLVKIKARFPWFSSANFFKCFYRKSEKT